MIKNKFFIINETEAGERLDTCVHNHFPELSKRIIQSSIKSGNIFLNGKTAKKGDILSVNDEIRILEIPEPQDMLPVANPDIFIEIIYENTDFFALNKPPGMPCHPITAEEKNTVVNFILHRYPETSGFGFSAMEPAILHRLDINTSGILLGAKNEMAFKNIRKLMAEKKIEKKYLALALGEIENDIEIDFPLMHHEKDKRKMKALQRIPEIKKAELSKKIFNAKTNLRIVKKLRGYTLVEAKILTGVMHQIRCHLASIKHPVAGDWMYQSSRQRKHDTLKPDRHLLHACEVILPPSITGKLKTITAHLPEDFREYISELENT